jgi:GNAT superfamily N-acetyltransferase
MNLNPTLESPHGAAPTGSMVCEGAALTLRNGQSVRVRPVRPVDADTIQEFVRRLSVTSRRLRFFSPIRELTPAMLARLTESTGGGQVLLAEAHDGETWCMVALAQYSPGDEDGACELAFVVADAWQGLGLGRALMEILIQSARDARFVRAVADVLRANEAMLALGRAYDFAVVRSPYDATILRLLRNLQDVLPTGRAWIPTGSAPQARPTAALAAVQGERNTSSDRAMSVTRQPSSPSYEILTRAACAPWRCLRTRVEQLRAPIDFAPFGT